MHGTLLVLSVDLCVIVFLIAYRVPLSSVMCWRCTGVHGTLVVPSVDMCGPSFS